MVDIARKNSSTTDAFIITWLGHVLIVLIFSHSHLPGFMENASSSSQYPADIWVTSKNSSTSTLRAFTERSSTRSQTRVVVGDNSACWANMRRKDGGQRNITLVGLTGTGVGVPGILAATSSR